MYRDEVRCLGNALPLQLGVQEEMQHGCNRDAVQQSKRQCNRECKGRHDRGQGVTVGNAMQLKQGYNMDARGMQRRHSRDTRRMQ